jgi:hypothetical protein
MRRPTANGRLLPLNDWEGDDFTPGAGGKWVTCMDTAWGRAVAFSTNGRIDKDGRWYRTYVNPPDPDGLTMLQGARAVAHATGLVPVVPMGWNAAKVGTQLRYARGLVIAGLYSTIPRAYRHQLRADFNHAMFVSHSAGVRAPGSLVGHFMRLYDPLNPDTHAYGRVVPMEILWPFLESLDYTVGYVPLQPKGPR